MKALVPPFVKRLAAPLRRALGRTDEAPFSPEETARTAQALRAIVQGTSRPSFVILPTQTWFSSGFQRPQQIARALAEVGSVVVFCEPWHCVEGWKTSETDAQRAFRGLRQLMPNLWLLRCPPAALVPVLESSPPDAILMNWPDQAYLLPRANPSVVVYEMIDDHAVMPHADDAWRKTHDAWVRDAGVLAASADDLVAQLRPMRPDVLLVPNGVRLEDWSDDHHAACPDDLTPARQRKLVVGYYGALAEWFDWPMWLDAAKERPEWSFVLIGYPYDGDAGRVHARIAPYRNVYYLGPKPYGELARYVRHIDVATIPFVLNDITHGCSPVKLFEYMAAGKPIVCSPMREILKYRSVRFATTSAEFVAKIHDAWQARTDPAYRALLRQEAFDNTWSARGRLLRDAVVNAAARRRADHAC